MNTNVKQHFNLGYLNKIGDSELIAEVIHLYLEETQSDLLKMKSALRKYDYDTIHSTVDKMKVSSGMIQADAMYLVLEEIDVISKYGGEYSKLCKLESFAFCEFNQLKYELNLYLKNMNKIATANQMIPVQGNIELVQRT